MVIQVTSSMSCCGLGYIDWIHGINPEAFLSDFKPLRSIYVFSDGDNTGGKNGKAWMEFIETNKIGEIYCHAGHNYQHGHGHMSQVYTWICDRAALTAWQKDFNAKKAAIEAKTPPVTPHPPGYFPQPVLPFGGVVVRIPAQPPAVMPAKAPPPAPQPQARPAVFDEPLPKPGARR